MARKQATFTIGDIEGTGATKSEAQADALLKAGATLRHETLIPTEVFPGWIVFRLPETWAYMRDGKILCTGMATREAACQSCAYHAVQYRFKPEDKAATQADLLRARPYLATMQNEDLAKWCAWQEHYAAARASGGDETEARRYADTQTEVLRTYNACARML